jgi:hypothetical protein
MCIICKQKNLDGLKILDCSNCHLLTNIPQINGLQKLFCYNCPLLRNVPHINTLDTLFCSDCPLLDNIPLINGLKTLDCSKCPKLTNVPDGLQKLWCNGCRLLTRLDLKNNTWLGAYGCVWLKRDPNFNESIKKLVILQRWFRSMSLSLRLKRLIPQIIPLYYHPDAKGGYFDKLSIMRYFEQLQ